MLIRRAMEGDVETLVQFNIALAKESENEILSVDVVTAGVRFALTHPAYAFYLVAELEGRVAGSLMITFEWSDWHNGLFYWIQSVYVRPELREQGIYRAMHEQVVALAQKIHWLADAGYMSNGTILGPKMFMRSWACT